MQVVKLNIRIHRPRKERGNTLEDGLKSASPLLAPVTQSEPPLPLLGRGGKRGVKRVCEPHPDTFAAAQGVAAGTPGVKQVHNA